VHIVPHIFIKQQLNKWYGIKHHVTLVN